MSDRVVDAAERINVLLGVFGGVSVSSISDIVQVSYCEHSPGTISRRDVRSDATGMAAWVVVFFDGSYASSGIMPGLRGQMPVLANAEMIVDFLNAFCRAVW